ncbi:MAG: peptidylprolyl isomerase [Erysipelotrichaceae bacterium]|nr:peptidylprolyl isomerase [Erysipelotrichaceae bacterium]MBR5049436.1 peptidylprolyl isomerase [Erysipelotrichaceae bacterium]
MKKFIKENWFVAVIAVFFVAISIYFAYDQHKDDLPGKSIGGKDVAFGVADHYTTMDDLYDGLYKSYGESLIGQQFSNAVLDNAVETTQEMETTAQSYTDYYAEMYSAYGGLSYLNQVAQIYYGYSDFKTYMLYSLKSQELSTRYISAHAEEYVDEAFIEKYDPRIISYCLIKFEDPANPTADEQERLKKAQEAWASADYDTEKFADFARNFSEDSSTASSGGKLGYVDSATTSLVSEFTEAAMKLKAGEVSDWVYSENYGYFLIKCDSTSLADYSSESDFVSRILTIYENVGNEIMWKAAQEAGVTFSDPDIEAYIKSELGLESEDK